MSFSFDRRVFGHPVEIVEGEAKIGKNLLHGNATSLLQGVNSGLDRSRFFGCHGLVVHWR